MYQYRLPSVIVSNRNLILWQYVVRNFFTVLPDNIRRNMLWRGKKFRPIDKQSSFILWKKIENNPYVQSYFPSYPKNVYPDKNYFYKVMNTILDDYITRALD